MKETKKYFYRLIMSLAKEKIKKKIPFLKEFNPKFTKRENIDKKVLRKFKKYLKDYYKSKKNDFDKLDNKEFWIFFLNGNLFPPMKFYQKDQNRTVEFKSFNTQYMAWVFSHKSSAQLYEMFLKENGDELYNSIIKKFKISCDSRENIDTLFQLRSYVFNIADIFTSVNTNSSINLLNTAFPNCGVSSYQNTQNDEITRGEMRNTLITENSIEMPAALPNSKGFIFDQLINHNKRVNDEDQIYYNKDSHNPCNEELKEDSQEALESDNTFISDVDLTSDLINYDNNFRSYE